MRLKYFTPGPSELYPGLDKHIAEAVEKQVGSVSHRSPTFESWYKLADEGLRALLNIPPGFSIFFFSSATEIWERLAQNCVHTKSVHLVNGSFSERFWKIAGQMGKDAQKLEAPFGTGFGINDLEFPADTELLSITANETSSGVQFPMEWLDQVKQRSHDALITVDGVSSIPYIRIDFSQVDCVYFSVQKAFGLPAGLGVAILNDACIQKAETLAKEGNVIGSYHSFPSLQKKYASFQTPETPNATNIFLLGKVVQDMLHKGIDKIRDETDQKAEMIYSFFERQQNMQPLVQEVEHRSRTVAVIETPEGNKDLLDRCLKNGFVVGTGYGKYKSSQIRIANFPAHAPEDLEKLLSLI